MTDRTVVYRLQAEIAQFQAKMAQASASTRKLAGDLTAQGKSAEASRKHLRTVGTAAGVAGAAAAAGLGLAVKRAADFDEAMSAVQAATHESASNMEELRAAALKAGADTVYSASEAAGAIEELSKAGVSTADILGGGLTGALNLAAAGGVDVADAAEAAASAMTQFGLSGQQVPHIADLLAAGAGKAQGGVDDLAMALKQSGLVAAQAGLSIEETTGALSAFASAGLLGSDAGTSFKTMLLRLTPQTERQKNLMTELGLSAFDAQGEFIGLEQYAGKLQKALAGMTDEQRQATLQILFGQDAIRAANVLYDQGARGIADWISKVDDSGYAAETAATRLDNLKGDLEQLSGSLETALIGTGDGSQGFLRSTVQGLTDLVNAYNALPGPVKDVTAGVLGFTAVAGGGLWVFSKMVTGIASAKAAYAGLGAASTATTGKMRASAAFLTGPWGLAMAGATLLVGQLWMEHVKAQAQIDAFTNSLDRQTGALTEDTYRAAAEALSGWSDAAKDAGISSDQLVGAVVNGGDALDKVAQKFEDYQKRSFGSSFWNQVTGDSGDFRRFLEATNQQLDEGQSKWKFTEEAVSGYDDATRSATTATSQSTAANRANEMSLKDLVAAMEKRREAALRNQSAELNYQSSLLDTRDAIKANGKTLDENTREGIANRQALLAQAAAWNDLSKQAKNTPGAFKEARQAFIDAAEAMGMGKKAAGEYADKLLEIPTRRDTRIDLESEQASSKLARFKQAWDALHDKTVRLNVLGGAGIGPQRYGYAMGGYVSGPGGPREDKVPAWLSNGEFVMTASATARHRSTLEAMNAQSYAGGGHVPIGSGSASDQSLLASIDRRLASLETLQAAAPAATGAHVGAALDAVSARAVTRR